MRKESSRLHQWLATAGVLPVRDDLVLDDGLSTSTSDYLHLSDSCLSAGPVLHISLGDEIAERFCPCVLEESAGAVDTRILIAAVGALCTARAHLDAMLGEDGHRGVSERGAFPSFLPAMLYHTRSPALDGLAAIPATLPAAHGLAESLAAQWDTLLEETRPSLETLDFDLVRYAVRALLLESLRLRIFGEFILPDAARVLDGIHRWATDLNGTPSVKALADEWASDPFLMREGTQHGSALVHLASDVVATAAELRSRMDVSLSAVRLVLPAGGGPRLRDPDTYVGDAAVRWLACRHGSRAMTATRCYLQHPQIVAEWLQSHPSPLVGVDAETPVTRAELLAVVPDVRLAPCQWEIAGALLSDLEQGGDFVAEHRLDALLTASRL